MLAAELWRANLLKTELKNATLMDANLTSANLTGADLTDANLIGAKLIFANLCKANITGAKLYGTARDDWKIEKIKCDYVFWDDIGEQKTPNNRVFRPNEFQELYNQLPTIEYIFENGFTAIDAVIMARVVQAINERHPEFELKLDSFHSRGQPHAKFTVLHKEYLEEARKKIREGHEIRIKALEGQVENIQKILSALADTPKMLINTLSISGGEFTMGNKQIGRDNVEISGNAQVKQFTTGEGDSFQGDYAQKLLQSTTPQSSQDEIVKLLSFVQQELPKLPLPEETKEEVTNEVKGAEIQAKKDSPDKVKIAGKLKSATEALKESAKTVKEAVMVGNLLGKAIDWCGEQWIEWMI